MHNKVKKHKMPATASVTGIDGTAFMILFSFSVFVLAWSMERVLSKLTEIAVASKVTVYVTNPHADTNVSSGDEEDDEEGEVSTETNGTAEEAPAAAAQ
jgi:hypothetical protein